MDSCVKDFDNNKKIYSSVEGFDNNQMITISQSNLEAICLLKEYKESGGKELCPYSSLDAIKKWISKRK